MLHFAYGSNLDAVAMATRCPGARPVGPARLARHRVVILREGYASVVRDRASTVWGLLWDLPLADVPALDRYEEVGRGLYAKLQQPVLTAAGPRRALVYVGRGHGGVPRPGHIEAVVTAARLVGLPEVHLRALAALSPRRGSRGTGMPRVAGTR